MSRLRLWLLIMVSMLAITGYSFLLTGCSAQAQQVQTAAEGLDLHALVGVVRQSSNGEDLERRLNTGGGINNLDLDNDGKVDFLDVTEFGEGEFRGYSLVVHLDEHNTQEVAEVKIHQGPSDFTIQVKGNEQIYGGHSFVTSHIARHEMSAVPFLMWAFMPRPLYIRPIVIIGQRPGWYSPPIVVPITQYRTVTKVVTKTVVVERPRVEAVVTPSTVTNPNAGRAAATIKAPLAAPTATQQQFQARPDNKPVAIGGFGRTKETTGTVTHVPERDVKDKAVLPHQAPAITQKVFEAREPTKKVETGGFGNTRTGSGSTKPKK